MNQTRNKIKIKVKIKIKIKIKVKILSIKIKIKVKILKVVSSQETNTINHPHLLDNLPAPLWHRFQQLVQL